nr:cytochrome c oxidase assembly protein [Caenimonas aquaedulcis]
MLAPVGAWAHAPESPAAGPSWTAWNTQPWLLFLLAVSLLFYAAGLLRLWRHAGAGHGIPVRQAASFAAGWLALVAALVSPLDAMGSLLFSAHMVQHEMLMIVAAPLLVLGRPLAAWTWALPAVYRMRLPALVRSRSLAWAWDAITQPVSAWALHAIALWAWHAPQLFEAALRSEGLHVLQHASFFVTALLFWWAVLGPDARSRRAGLAMVLLFTTMMHTGALGALLALAPTPWYPPYVDAAVALGIDPVQDQQLGGLVMWVPGSVAYLVVGLQVIANLLGRRAKAMA